MKKILNIVALCATILAGLSFTSCNDDDLSTNQYNAGYKLNVFGPSPAMRGGQLRFMGSNLDQTAQVIIPGSNPITAIDIVKSGVPSEIKVTIPQDATPGKVTLVSKTDQKQETVTDLVFTEPIVIDEFAPASVMPGEVITIKGDYLNLVGSVTFSEDVSVSSKEFKAQSRSEIQVVVPEAAMTGKIAVNDADVTDLPEGDISYNTIVSEKALQVGTPTISKVKARNEVALLGTVTAKKGETITFTGTYFNLISSVTFGEGEEPVAVENFKVSEDGKTLTVTLPAEAPAGAINLVCKSSVVVPAAKLETIKPTELKSAPAPAKNGSELTITGKDLDVVSSLQFPNVAEATSFKATETEIKVTIPVEAQEGNIILSMANGESVEVAYTLVKPAVTSYSAKTVSAGSAMSINGTNLDLVASVSFNGSAESVEVESDGSVINLTVPMDATSGAVTFNLKNGTTVTCADIAVEEAKFCYAKALPGEEDEIHAGDLLSLEVANIDKLTSVEIDGQACQTITKTSTLVISVPETAKKGSKVRLISSNGEITYTINFIPNTEITTVIWKGEHSALAWKNGMADLAWGGYDWSTVTPGTELVVNFISDPDKTYSCQIRFGNGSWAALPGTKALESADNDGNIIMADDAKEYRLTLTQEMLDEMKANGGLVICGAWFILSKVSLVEHISFETTVWKGEFNQPAWTNWEVGKGNYGDNNPSMFIDEGVKAGSVIRVYVTPTDAWWQFQLFDGHWAGLADLGDVTGANNGNNLNTDNYTLVNGAIEIPVNASIAEKLTTLTDWGQAWIIQCENLIVTKITIE